MNLPAGALPRTEPAGEDKPPEPETPREKPAAPPPPKPAEKPAEKPPAPPPAPVQPSAPAAQIPASPAAPPAASPPARQAPAVTRDCGIYFTQVDKDGVIVRSRISRKLAVSDSPMLDSLNALLSGPAADERRRGLVSFIPPHTRVLSAIVRGNTAYISFSEDFQYNTYGIEGYAAQIQQIVWTATEFSNIHDVQILVEGRRVDFLGEGIWIGSPVGRGAF